MLSACGRMEDVLLLVAQPVHSRSMFHKETPRRDLFQIRFKPRVIILGWLPSAAQKIGV